MNKEFIECDCGCHVVVVCNEVEGHEQDFYFAMFRYGLGKRSLWQRLKLCWKILRTREQYEDQVVMNRDQAAKLYLYLGDNIKP